MKKILTHKEGMEAFLGNQIVHCNTLSGRIYSVENPNAYGREQKLQALLEADQLWIEVPDEEPNLNDAYLLGNALCKSMGLGEASREDFGHALSQYSKAIVAEAVRQAKREVAEAYIRTYPAMALSEYVAGLRK